MHKILIPVMMLFLGLPVLALDENHQQILHDFQDKGVTVTFYRNYVFHNYTCTFLVIGDHQTGMVWDSGETDDQAFDNVINRLIEAQK